MLLFIADLDGAELLAARAPDGTISSAALYAKLGGGGTTPDMATMIGG